MVMVVLDCEAITQNYRLQNDVHFRILPYNRGGGSMIVLIGMKLPLFIMLLAVLVLCGCSEGVRYLIANPPDVPCVLQDNGVGNGVGHDNHEHCDDSDTIVVDDGEDDG